MASNVIGIMHARCMRASAVSVGTAMEPGVAHSLDARAQPNGAPLHTCSGLFAKRLVGRQCLVTSSVLDGAARIQSRSLQTRAVIRAESRSLEFGGRYVGKDGHGQVWTLRRPKAGGSSDQESSGFVEGETPFPKAANKFDVDGSSEGEGKVCIDCQYFKPLVDFQKTVTTADGRGTACRACMAVLYAKRRGDELHGHLSLSPKEAWDQAKRCTGCGLKKELRDFAKNNRMKSGINNYCRSCKSVAFDRGTKFEVQPDASKTCMGCNKVKSMDQYFRSKKHRDGATPYCKVCSAERYKHYYASHKEARVYVTRETKLCNQCGKESNLSEFSVSFAMVDGRAAICRTCDTQKAKRRYHSRKKKLELEGDTREAAVATPNGRQ